MTAKEKPKRQRKHSHTGDYKRNRIVPGTGMTVQVCHCGAERVTGWVDGAGAGPWLTADERVRERLKMVTP